MTLKVKKRNIDNVLPILIYIAIYANIEYFEKNLQFLSKYLSSKSLKRDNGYILTTFNVAF